MPTLDLQYETNGSIVLGNCAIVSKTCNRIYRYPQGSILYDKSKALIGVLEKVFVKRIFFPKKCDYSCVVATPIYVDNFNKLYNEDNLVNYEDANYLIKEYNEYRNAILQQIALNCGN